MSDIVDRFVGVRRAFAVMAREPYDVQNAQAYVMNLDDVAPLVMTDDEQEQYEAAVRGATEHAEHAGPRTNE